MARLLLYSPTSRLAPGGVQAVVTRLAANLRGAGHEVWEGWAAPGAEARPHEWVVPLEVTAGASNRPTIRAVPRAIAGLARLSLGLARRRPQLVNVHFLSGHVSYFLELRRVFGYRLVLSVHGSDLMRPSPQLRHHLPRFLRAADAVTVVSAALHERVLAHPGVDPARVHRIANGIDHAFWSDGSSLRRREKGPATIVAAGRLERVKGFDVLLGAFALLRRIVPDARLVVAGDGSERTALAAQAAAAGLSGSVELPGHLDPQALRERFRAAAVFALPSRDEGMPLVLLQAMAAGTVVVASAVGGVQEVVTPGSGLLVPPEDPERLADALARVLTDEQRADALAVAGASRSRAFSSADCDAAYRRLFAGLLRSGATGSRAT